MPRTGHCCCQAVCRPVLPLKRPPQEPMARYRRNEFGQASDLSARLMQIKVRRDSGLIALCAMKSPLSVAAALVPVSALAAETPAESYTWGHPMMWGWGWSGMIFGPLFMILVLAVVIAVAVLIVRSGSAVPGMVPRRRIIHPLAARRSTSSKSALHGAKLTRTSSRIAAACSASKRAVHTTVLILNDPPYGSERSYNGLRLAVALAKQDSHRAITVFLMADAVSCAKKGQNTPDGYYNIERMLKRFTLGSHRGAMAGSW